jgi:hypothetical protein
MNVHVKDSSVDGIRLTPAQLRSRKARSLAIGLAVAAFALIFYAVTIVKLSHGVLQKALG